MIRLRNFFKKGEAGFTLVELLVVIVILGILAGIGVQQFTGVQQRAAETANDANIRILRGAAQLAVFKNGGAPEDNVVVWREGYQVVATADTVNNENPTAPDETSVIIADWDHDEFLEDWPGIPTGLKSNSEYEDAQGYQVVIHSSGKIEVYVIDDEFDKLP